MGLSEGVLGSTSASHGGLGSRDAPPTGNRKRRSQGGPGAHREAPSIPRAQLDSEPGSTALHPQGTAGDRSAAVT